MSLSNFISSNLVTVVSPCGAVSRSVVLRFGNFVTDLIASCVRDARGRTFEMIRFRTPISIRFVHLDTLSLTLSVSTLSELASRNDQLVPRYSRTRLFPYTLPFISVSHFTLSQLVHFANLQLYLFISYYIQHVLCIRHEFYQLQQWR